MFDFRSDTVTRPSSAMRQAMASAEVGDDVFGDDPTVNALQDRVAELLGKEKALFVPTGTMANQIAVHCHTTPGDEIYCHAGSHVLNYEGGAAAILSNPCSRWRTIFSKTIMASSTTIPMANDKARTVNVFRVNPKKLMMINTDGYC